MTHPALPKEQLREDGFIDEASNVNPSDTKQIKLPKQIKGKIEYHSSPPSQEYLKERELEGIAMNIVFQIGDALYEALPPDIAHKHFVDARQATNDIAIDFAKKLLTQYGLSERKHEAADIHDAGIELLMKNNRATLGQLLDHIERKHGKDLILHVYGKSNELNQRKEDS